MCCIRTVSVGSLFGFQTEIAFYDNTEIGSKKIYIECPENNNNNNKYIQFAIQKYVYYS